MSSTRNATLDTLLQRIAAHYLDSADMVSGSDGNDDPNTAMQRASEIGAYLAGYYTAKQAADALEGIVFDMEENAERIMLAETKHALDMLRGMLDGPQRTADMLAWIERDPQRVTQVQMFIANAVSKHLLNATNMEADEPDNGTPMDFCLSVAAGNVETVIAMNPTAPSIFGVNWQEVVEAIDNAEVAS
jgi:hypothetical protein